MQRANEGITLIALVITVIILLILAAVAMSLITGQGGLFAKSNRAGYEYNTAAYVEKEQVEGLYGYLEAYGENDLDNLKKYFAKGWDEIYWYDDQTDEGGYNNIEPIMDASTSIHDFYDNATDFWIEYNGNYYRINEEMEVYPANNDLDLIKLKKYFGNGWNVIYWYDTETGESGFNNIEPIMDASTSIHIENGVEGYTLISYNGRFYKYDQISRVVSYATDEEALYINIIGSDHSNVCSNGDYTLVLYNGYFYLVNLYNVTAKIVDNIDVNTFGEYNIEEIGTILVTPSTPDYLVHGYYSQITRYDEATGNSISAYYTECDTESGRMAYIYNCETGELISIEPRHI